MNKLISRNPVQRFKEGRKILFAQRGNQIITLDGKEYWRGGNDWYYRPKGKEGMTKVDYSDRTFYSSAPKGGVIAKTYNDIQNSLHLNGSYYEKTINGKVAERGRWQNGKTIPIKNNKKFVKREYIDPNGNLFKWNEDENGNYISGQTIDPTSGNVYQRGSDGSITLIRKGNIKQNSPINSKPKGKKSVVTNRVLSKYSGVDLQGKTVGEWQNILKDFYTPGTYKNDGIWGDNTEAAYEAYLEKQKLEHPTLDNLQLPTSILSPISSNNISNVKMEVPQQTYNRSQIREFIRNKGINPYSFSGAQRRALRMVLNGTADDNDKLLVKGMGIFKKGGQLPSRNVVERFKNGGIQKFQKAGNLPTAPKAKDRYKDSYKSWDWPQYKEVTAGSRLFPGARISQTIEGSDTTYMETPPRFPFVKVVPRVAKNNTKTIEWRDLITGQTYPEVKRGNSREYETLKRRFNTAWNLAK